MEAVYICSNTGGEAVLAAIELVYFYHQYEQNFDQNESSIILIAKKT